MTKQITALLAITILIISGCAPRAGAESSASDGELHVSFPAILVEYDENGEASVLNMPVSDLKDSLGVDLSALSFEASTIDDLTGGGIDVIHIDNQPGGIRFFVNGQSYPSLVWDDEARSGMLTTLEQMGTDAGPLAGILGLLPDLGMGLTMKMPGASNSNLSVSRSSLLDEDVADDVLATARAVNPIQTIALSYNEQGIPQGSLPPTFAAFGVTPQALALPADTLASLQEQGIESINILPTGSGIRVSINGNTLPFLSWNSEELNRMLSLLPIFAGDSLPSEVLDFLPTLMGLPLGIDLEFPS